MIVINGGIFNFIEGGYSPPLSGATYDFSTVTYTLRQIWSDDDYVYTAHTGGLEVIDRTEELRISYATFSGGFTTVWGNDDSVYFGTLASGVKYILKSCITGTTSSPDDIITCLTDYVPPLPLSSNAIRYIHGSGTKYLMVCTDVGIDVYHTEPTIYKSSATITGVQKGFMTSSGKFYYTVGVSGSLWSLNRVNTPFTDWTTPDYIYYADGTILASGVGINDIFVTENTASNGTDNTVFVATTSGVYVIDEGSLVYVIYYSSGG